MEVRDGDVVMRRGTVHCVAGCRHGLAVDPSVVYRDERNEYHGVTLECAAKILNAMRAELRTSVEVPGHGLATLPRETPGSHDAAATDWHEPAMAGRRG